MWPATVPATAFRLRCMEARVQALALPLPAGSHAARDPGPRRQGRAAPRSPPRPLPPAGRGCARVATSASGPARARFWSAADGGRATRGGPIASRRASRARPQSAAGPRRARHGARLRRPGAPSGALSLRGRDAGVPLAGRPGPPPGRLPGGGGRPPAPLEAAMRMSTSRAGRAALGAAAAAGVRHMAHRFIVGETPAAALQADPAAVGARRRGVARPAGGGDRDRGRGRPLRRPLPRGARHARRGRAGLARPPRARARRPRTAPSGEPVREGVGPDARCSGRRRPRPAARTPPGGCARSC